MNINFISLRNKNANTSSDSQLTCFQDKEMKYGDE